MIYRAIAQSAYFVIVCGLMISLGNYFVYDFILDPNQESNDGIEIFDFKTVKNQWLFPNDYLSFQYSQQYTYIFSVFIISHNLVVDRIITFNYLSGCNVMKAIWVTLVYTFGCGIWAIQILVIALGSYTFQISSGVILFYD